MDRKPGSVALLLKAVSWVLLFTFSWSQIVFADDLGSTNIGKALDRLNSEESQTFAPAYIQYQEISHQELVRIKQDIENLANTRLPMVDADDTNKDDLAPQSKEAVALKGPQGGSGQSSAPSEAPTLTPQENADVILQTNSLVDNGELIEYLNESALYKERADMLARRIAVAREGLSAADDDVINTMEKISSKDDEIARILDSIAALDILDRARAQETVLKNTLSALKAALDSKKAELNSAVLELEFAKIDYENSISLIKQNLGADFDIYSSPYEKEAGPDNRITSVILQDRRDSLESVVADAKDQVGESEKASLNDLALKVKEAKNKVYEDEAISLGQLDGLCEQRINEIIAARDEGFADIEQQRIDVTAEANSQFGSLYASVSAQASYWGSRKAALYQSGQIDAYIYAATMATVYGNQAYSVASQWASQIAGINQQCDAARTKLESDAEAAINNVPAEKEAAIAEIKNQRDSLLDQIGAVAIEQENSIFTERDNALAEIETQRSETLSTIQAEESLILTAWQVQYIIDDLGAVIIGKGQEVSVAKSAYEESKASYDLFLEDVLTPAETAFNTALSLCDEALDNISLNDRPALLAMELSALADSLAEKTLYRDNIALLLTDMLDAEKLLIIKNAEMMGYYALLLSQRESLGGAVKADDSNVGNPIVLSEEAPSEPTIAIGPPLDYLQPEGSVSASSSLADIAKESLLLDAEPEPAGPSPVAAADAEEEIPVEGETDNKELLMRCADFDSKLLDTFRSLFNRDATEGGIDLFNQMMIAPRLPAIKLIEVSKKTENGTVYHIVDGRIISATIEGKTYIFNDNGNIDQVLSQSGYEILDYLYDDAGDLMAINFSNARASLENARDSASSVITEKFDSYRSALEEQKKILEDEVVLKYAACLSSIDERAASINDGVLKEYSERVSALESEKAKLDALQNYLEKKAGFMEGLSVDARVYTSDGMTGDIDSVRAQINSIDEAIQRVGLDKAEALQIVDNERAKAVSVLGVDRDGAIADISAKIEGIANSLVVSEDAVKTKLADGAADAFSVIRTQEDFGLIRYYFKESLGREPTYDEMAFCAENDYTTKESLSGSVFKEELAARKAFKDSVIENVRTALEDGRFSSLSQEDKTAILNYLNGQSLHFGMSALVPLSEALRSQGIEVGETELLTELILSEIAAGNLGQADNAQLKISMNAMIDVAKAHGVELSGFGATMDELEAVLKDSGKSAIALINEDHYVTVLNIDSDTVTYLDPSMGKDGANATIPKDEFNKKFSGNVIAKAGTIDSSKLLSKDKLIAAKGAGFWDWVGKMFNGIGEFFSDMFEALGRFISNVVNSIVDGIRRAVDVIVDVAKNIAMIPVNFVKDIVAGNWSSALWTVASLVPGVGAIKAAIDGDWASAGIQAGALLLSAAIPGAGAAASGIGGAITGFASAIIAPIADTIAPFVSGISSVVGGISNFVGAFGSAIGSITSSVGQVFKPITDFTSSIISSISASPIGQVVATIKDGIVTPTITIGILEGAKVTLTDLGLNGTIADIGGAAIAGYAGAYMNGNGAIAIPITLGSIVSQSFKELGATFDFDETITSALSLVAGSFVTNSIIRYDQNNVNTSIEDTLGSEASNFGRLDAMSSGEMSSYSLSGISEDSQEYALYDSIDTTITSAELLDRMAVLSLLNVVSDDFGNDNNSDPSTGIANSGTVNNEEYENRYLLMNGINNEELYTAPLYMKNFAAKLDSASPGVDDISIISLYNDSVTVSDDTLSDLAGSRSMELLESLQASGYVNSNGTITRAFYDLEKASQMILYDEFIPKQEAIFATLKNIDKGMLDDISDLSRDAAKWLTNTSMVAAEINDEVTSKYGPKWPEDATAMCYSGSGDPFICLLNNNPQYDVNSIVLVGTPIKGERKVENANIENIVTIYGENDPVFFLNEGLREDFYAASGKLFPNNPDPINEIVIKLKDADHSDYFYDPTDSGPRSDFQKKATEFIARVTAAAKDSYVLKRFLATTAGVSKDPTTGKYTVDLRRVVYDK